MALRASVVRTAVVALVAAGGAFGVMTLSSAGTGAATAQPVCQKPTRPGRMGCLSLRVPRPAAAAALATPRGYGPADLQSAYRLPTGTAGTGRTVAIVDAYDYPSAEADLATYRSTYGLPACTTANGCFRKVDEHGGTRYPKPAPKSDDWTGEIALDIDMVSAVCPNCHILLLEAVEPTGDDLGTAVDTAVRLGAKYVSNSYGGNEDPSLDHYYNHPGVVVTASSGDDGDLDFGSPAADPFVTAVGGTTLTRSATATRGWTESAWDGSGSGCTSEEPKPSWQKDTGCSHRSGADVAAVADPKTGVAVYDTFNGNGGWNVFGGTSASSPIVAAASALAGTPRAGDYPVTYPYLHKSSLFDVTKGSNGSVGDGVCTVGYLCNAGTGYDGPTGLGTPNGVKALRRGTVGAVSVARVANRTSVAGQPASLTVSATDSAGRALTYRATNLPPGLSIDRSTGVISGTAKALGTYGVAVTATDTAGAWDSAGFIWTTTVGPRGALHVTFATAPQSTGNVTVTVTIANTGATAVTGWSVYFEMPFDQDVGSYWDALVSTGADSSFTVTQVTATNRDYNATVPAHGSVTFGFVGQFTGSSWRAPTNCRIGFNAC
jgi:putative Ig domain-containing protein/cellulose binding protein with CBM2 domain